jgi:hypothetical protein
MSRRTDDSAKAGIDLRERQNEVGKLLRKQAEKFIRCRIDDAKRSSALGSVENHLELMTAAAR